MVLHHKRRFLITHRRQRIVHLLRGLHQQRFLAGTLAVEWVAEDEHLPRPGVLREMWIQAAKTLQHNRTGRLEQRFFQLITRMARCTI